MNIKAAGRTARRWFEERLGISAVVDFLRHKQIPLNRHTPLMYTGSVILLFFGIQVVTGILLAFYYRPTLEAANKSVAEIMIKVPLGWIVRSVHSWSATFMIAAVFVHMFGLWLAKSYRKPRELTWMSGAVLLLFALAFGFTGYLLPWDDLSLAATKVGTDIPGTIPVVGAWVTKFLRGGDDISGDTLSRFHTLHVCVLPLLVLAFIGFHLYLVQKLGMSLPLGAEDKEEAARALPFWPNFVYREAIVWSALAGLLVTVAVFLPPSLGNAADLMAAAPEGITPEWYFLFLFQTLKIFPANMLIVTGETVAVLLIAVGAALLFFLPLIDSRPAGKKGRAITWAAPALIVYAAAMSIWSLTGAKAQPESVVPSPANIRESTAISVFIGWMWLSIGVLVYLLRLKIMESDRLHFARYFNPDKT